MTHFRVGQHVRRHCQGCRVSGLCEIATRPGPEWFEIRMIFDTDACIIDHLDHNGWLFWSTEEDQEGANNNCCPSEQCVHTKQATIVGNELRLERS
jgi:hypothetical protein